MRLQIEQLGKVSVTVEENYWNINNDYDKLTIVEKEGIFGTYISRKPVPSGTELTNRKYWIPFSSLRENIVIDYNSFIDKYKTTLESYGTTLTNHDARIRIIENIKSVMDSLTNETSKMINASKETLSKADGYIIKANEVLSAAKLALKDSENVRAEAQNAVKIANDAANIAKTTANQAATTLVQANNVLKLASDATDKANEAYKNSEKAICVANKYYQLAKELKALCDELYIKVLEQDGIIKQEIEHCKCLHKHIYELCTWVRDEIAKINKSITVINENITSINSVIDDINKTLNEHQKHLELNDSKIKKLDDNKVDKVEGKELSTNDFTNALKAKLESLFNYDDSELREKIETLITNFNTLVNANPTQAIENFNEIIAFLNNITDSETLEGIIAAIQLQIGEVDKKINDIRTNFQFKIDDIEENISSLSETKVDKVEGKGLSTNDFDNDYKDKLDNLETTISDNTLIKSVNNADFTISDDKKLSIKISNDFNGGYIEDNIYSSVPISAKLVRDYIDTGLTILPVVKIHLYQGNREISKDSVNVVTEGALAKHLKELEIPIYKYTDGGVQKLFEDKPIIAILEDYFSNNVVLHLSKGQAYSNVYYYTYIGFIHGGELLWFQKIDTNEEISEKRIAISNENCLHITGGTVHSAQDGVFIIKKDDTSGAFTSYENDNGLLGRIGIGGTTSTYPGEPSFITPQNSSKKIWHEGNDGVGSGLDADLLDGKHNGELTAVHIKSSGVSTNLNDLDLTAEQTDKLVFSKCTTKDTPNLPGTGDNANSIITTNIGHFGTGYQYGHQLVLRSKNAYFRRYGNNTYDDWKEIAFTDSNVASANKLITKQLTNEDLNEIRSINFVSYYAAGSNACKNIPSSITNDIGFRLIVSGETINYCNQTLITSIGVIYKRVHNGSLGWSDWKRLLTEDDISLPTIVINDINFITNSTSFTKNVTLDISKLNFIHEKGKGLVKISGILNGLKFNTEGIIYSNGYGSLLGICTTIGYYNGSFAIFTIRLTTEINSNILVVQMNKN